MDNKALSFDEVFKIWLDAEVLQVEGRDLLPVAKSKGFNSVTEWRLDTAIRLGMDQKSWTLESLPKPNQQLPEIIVGPYQGWSKFFENRLNTTFREALEIPEFLEWVRTHDRVIPISENFPLPTTVILFRKPDGRLIHIEGGHRICAAAYREKQGKPIDFGINKVKAAIADISQEEVDRLIAFLAEGTFKK